MKLSLCAIVKNDQLLIKKMLDSVVGVVDEIIVADTGSTDRTVEVMETFQKEHPGLLKILHFEWINSFSAARNFTFEHATGDWILVIDADEFLDAQEKWGLVPFLEQSSADGIFVKVRNYTGSMKDLTTVVELDACRVFRRGYKYEGDIHEQIADFITLDGGRLEYFNLHVHHVGYATEYIQLKNKSTRNTTILEKELQSNEKKDKNKYLFAKMNLLVEHVLSHQWEVSIAEARSILSEIKRWNPKKRPDYMLRVFKYYILALRSLGRLEEALDVVNDALKYYPSFTDLYMEKAGIYLGQQDYRSMIDQLKICRKLGDVKFHIVEYLEGNGTYHASRLMGHGWLCLGDDLTAREWFVKSYTENTQQPGVLPWIVLLTVDKQILHATEKTIQTPQRYEEFIEYYSYLGFDDALTFIEKAESMGCSREVIKRARFGHVVRQGQVPTSPDNPTDEDKARMALWFYEQGDKEKAKQLWFEAGVLGEYYLQIQKTQVNWELKNVFLNFWAVKATNFLRDYGTRIADLGDYFRIILHSDLLSAFTEDDFLAGDHDSLEAWEWKAQVYLAKGDSKNAERCLDKAYLPNGERTVRGYIIAGDVHKANQAEIIRTGRKEYPESQMLSYIWMNYFAPSLQKQILLM